MSNVFLFDWDNYDDNPLYAIGVNTIPTQKEATYAPAAEGELVADAFDTFMSNGDEYAYPQVAEVAGEEAKVLVLGEGFISPEPQPEPPSVNGYMYLEAAEANSTVSMVSTLETAPDLEYSTDGVTWQEWQHTTTEGIHIFDTITLGAIGDKVYFRGDNPNGFNVFSNGSPEKFSYFVLTGSLYCHGDAQTLVDGDNVTSVAKSMPMFSEGVFTGRTSPSLLSTPSLTASVLTPYCYSGIFSGCTSLLTVAEMPKLTIIPEGSLMFMYGKCTSLVETVDMSSVTAIDVFGCAGMYQACNSLTSAAEMPLLTTIGEASCSLIYYECRSLVSSADMLYLTEIGEQGGDGMYQYCSSLTSAADMPNVVVFGGGACMDMYTNSSVVLVENGQLTFGFPQLPIATTDGQTYSTPEEIANWMSMRYE